MSWHDPTRGPRGRGGEDGRVRRAFDTLTKKLQDALVPPGALFPFIGTTAPDKYCLCYGQTLTGASELYPKLWEYADTTWKSGNNLVVPDVRGRIPVGLDNMGGSDAGRLTVANTMGGTGGQETHVHRVNQNNATGGSASGFLTSTVLASATLSAANFENSGSPTSSNSMQPYILLNWILKLV